MLTTVRGHTFVPGALGDHPVVVDLGAHRGEFAAEVLDRFGGACHAVEASPHLFAELPERNGLHSYHLALADRDAELAFHLSAQPDSSSIRELPEEDAEVVSVPSRTLDSLLGEASIDHVDLLKVDIEGAERELFRSTPDETLRRIGQISVEFHDFLGLTDKADLDHARFRLSRLGFFELKMSRDNTNWLFIQPELTGTSKARLLLARYGERNVAGLRRVIARRR